MGRFGRGEEGVVDGLRFGSLGEWIGVGGCDETSVGWGMGVSGVGEGRVWREGWEWARKGTKEGKGKGWGVDGFLGSHSLGVRLCHSFQGKRARKDTDRHGRRDSQATDSQLTEGERKRHRKGIRTNKQKSIDEERGESDLLSPTSASEEQPEAEKHHS